MCSIAFNNLLKAVVSKAMQFLCINPRRVGDRGLYSSTSVSVSVCLFVVTKFDCS